jgi:hypothetical protein
LFGQTSGFKAGEFDATSTPATDVDDF